MPHGGRPPTRTRNVRPSAELGSPRGRVRHAPVVTGVRGRACARPVHRLPFALGTVVALLAWFRLPIGGHDVLYAEDGGLFVGEWVNAARIQLLWEPYAGYQHLLPRVLSGLITWVLPVAWWGVAVTASACAMIGLIGALVFVYSGQVVGYLPSRVVLALLPALVPIAVIEPLGNLANLHWFVLYLVPWVLIAVPRSRTGLVMAAAIAFICAATEPQSLVFLPLAIWRFVTLARSRLVVLGWALGMAAQAISYLSSPRSSPPGHPPVLSIVEGYLVNAGFGVITSRPELIGRILVGAGWWVGVAWVAVLLAAALIGFLFGRTDARAMLGSLMLGSFGSWILAYTVNNVAAYYYDGMSPDQLASPPLLRWGTSAALLLAAALPVAVGVLVERSRLWWPAALGVLVALVLVMLADLTHRGALESPTWSGEIAEAREQCAINPGIATAVPIRPPGWRVTLPCSAIGG